MKLKLTFCSICLLFVGSMSLDAQSYVGLFHAADSVKAIYGEKDQRFLDAYSKAIAAAFSEGELGLAQENRIHHLDIVKTVYGENSPEYAEDLWRLGNVSENKGADYQINCYERVSSILHSLNLEDEPLYCHTQWTLYWLYREQKNWDEAVKAITDFTIHATSCVDIDWKGNVIQHINIAHGYFIIGLAYSSVYKNSVSAIDAYKKCVAIIEEQDLYESYEYTLSAYSRIAIEYVNLEDYENSLPWRLRCVELAERLNGRQSEEFLQELSMLRYCYYSLQDVENTIATQKRLLSVIEERNQKNGTDVLNDSLYLDELNTLYDYFSLSNQMPEAISQLLSLLSIYEQKGQQNGERYFYYLGQLILAYQNTGHFLEAYQLYPRYEEIAQLLGSTSTEEYWYYLVLKTEALTNLYKLDEHEGAISELEALTTQLYGPNSRQSLLYTYQLANQYESLDQHIKAETGIKRCFEILSSGECHFESESDSLLYLAGIHNLEGKVYTSTDTSRAEASFLTAIEENRRIGRADYAPLVNLGLLYYQQKRDFKRALGYFEEAREVLERMGDNFSIQYITVLNNLGQCYQELGMASYAITIFDLASRTVLDNYGKQHVAYGATEQNKSIFYSSIADFPEAIKCAKETLECYRLVYGEDSEKYAISLQNLGVMYQHVKDYSKSKEILLSALPLLEKLNSPYCIYAYTNLLTIYAIEKDGGKLSELAKKAEDKLKENHWEETDVAASLYGAMGYSLLYNGVPEAKQYLGRALKLLDNVGAKNTIQYHRGLIFLGMAMFLDHSQSDDIIPVLTESYKNQYLTNAAYFNSNERESLITGSSFAQTKNVVFSSRQLGTKDTDLYNFLLFNKGLLLGTAISYAKAIYDSGNEELILEYDKLVRLNRYFHGESRENLNLSPDKAKSQASILEREITSFLRQNGDYTRDLDCSYFDVQKSLGADEIAIEFVSFHNMEDNTSWYAALLARSDYDAPKYITLCKKEDLEQFVSLSPGKLYGETPASENAYHLIWGPVIPYLNGIKTVYFSPAGYINNMAVEHLYDGEKRFESQYKAIRLTSTREVCRKSPQYKYAAAVLYGGLKYDEDDATMIAESRNIRGNNTQVTNVFRGLESNTTRKGWEYLPGTLEEVNQISSVLSKNKMSCNVYSSEKGNEESFKALSGNNFGILHIATHGFYMTESQAERNEFIASNPFASQNTGTRISPLQRSGLLLSGGNKAWKGEPVPEGVEDGIITAAEIASLDFNSCDVVVLSACETGLGEITDEGVLGLQRAFKNAGVNTIIMSLWNVDDQATSLMMQSFYRNLVKGKSKRDSFAAAQDEVRKKFPDPRYWAAFIMLD